MKKIACLIVVSLLLFGCVQSAPISKNKEAVQTETVSPDTKIHDDLVYRSYNNGIKLEKGNELYIAEPIIKLSDASKASIWVDNLETKEKRKIADYKYKTGISFTVDKTGTFAIYAMIENEGLISYTDLTNQGIIKVKADNSNLFGIRPLK